MDLSTARSTAKRTRVLVFASLFPSKAQPGAGLFIRERMFRVGGKLPLMVVSPRPWFPMQKWLRRWKPDYRPETECSEVQDGIQVYFPRFLSFPVWGRSLDGVSMALCCLPLMRKLQREFQFNVIDSHFAYPDGFAAAILGRLIKAKVTITLRGTEVPISKTFVRRRLMMRALSAADRVFSVSDSLKRHVVKLGAEGKKIKVVGNGVDVQKFQRQDRVSARRKLALDNDARVLITVGGLVPRKGFHRVIAALPALRREFGNVHYLVVGGASPEGNNEGQLRALATELGVEHCVHFLGPLAPSELKWPLSAADVFVLSSSNEGWANVILEAMACGLPVIATDVGGNREVVATSSLGTIVPHDNHEALLAALDSALRTPWDRDAIVSYAQRNSWSSRVSTLVDEFERLGGAKTERNGVDA